MNLYVKGILICLLAGLQHSESAPQLQVSQNDVSVAASGITTGMESRAELSNANATFRVGANSSVGFRSTESEILDLKQGVVMIDTARRGLGRKSLTVETDEITATTNATMMISYQPGRYIKIVCTAGKVKVALKGLGNDTVTIRKGQMLIINCLENVLPSAVSVDLSQLMQTSPLFASRLRGGPARNAATRSVRPEGTGPPRTGESSSPDRGDNLPPPPQGTRPPPPLQGPQNFGLLNQQARPQPTNLAVRRVDCRIDRNALECQTAARPAMNVAAMAPARGGTGGSGGGGQNTPAPAPARQMAPSSGGNNHAPPPQNSPPPPASSPPPPAAPPGGRPPRP